MGTSPIRVLVVDDSAYLRKVISQILSSDPNIEVIGTAWDGQDALEKVSELKPDVVTLDLFMPNLDGVGFLKSQMARHSLPVVIFTIASQGNTNQVAALEAGAVEFVQKPTALANERLYDIGSELIQKVIAAGNIPVDRLPVPEKQIPPATFHLPVPMHPSVVDAVVIGTSTGGPQALRYLLTSLPADFPVPIAVIVHMPEGYTGPFAERLNELSQIEVLEAKEGLEMKPGRAILGQAGYHLVLKCVDKQVTAHLDLEPGDLPHRPAVDVLFKSAAEVYSGRVLGVIMTGMGNDGTAGAAWIKAQGGKIFTEAESSCVVYGMPRSVEEAGLSDKIAPLKEMPEIIIEAV